MVDNGVGVQDLLELCENAPSHKRKVSRSLYGTRRGCLFHIVKLCQKVSVTTRRHNITTTKIFKTCQGSEIIIEKRTRPSRGTTITIDDVFHNIPVRLTSVSYMDLENTKDVLLKIAIANPSVAVTLKDISSGTKLFQTQACTSFLDNFLIYCHNKVSWEMMREIKFEFNGYRLEALFTQEVHCRPWQVVFVNRRFIEDDRIKKFASDILLAALAPIDKRDQENKFPVFLFSISCKPVNVDMCFESNSFLEFKDWDSIFHLIYRCVTSFLETEDICLPVFDEDPSYSSSPLHSMRSLLKAASPNVNIASDKAQRRTDDIEPTRTKQVGDLQTVNSNIAKGTTENKLKLTVTPRKTNHSKLIPNKRELENLNFSPYKNEKFVCRSKNINPAMFCENSGSDNVVNDSKFITPPSKHEKKFLSILGNAPVLNHLLDAKTKLDKESNQVIDFNSPQKESPSKTPGIGNLNKRRCSTPLCQSKNKQLNLNISPIQKDDKSKSVYPPVKTKRKRRRRPLKIPKEQAKAVPKFDMKESADMNKFSMKTPHHLLDSSKVCCSLDSFSTSENYQNGKRTTDSGYDTTSKLSHVFAFPDEKNANISNKKCDMFFDEASTELVSDSISSSNKPFEGNDNKDSEPYSMEKLTESPQKFKVYWDNQSTTESSNCKDDIMLDKSQSSKRFTIFEDPVPSPANIETVTSKKGPFSLKECPISPLVMRKDCGSSPILIPVERGCSPIDFSQMQIRSDMLKPSLEICEEADSNEIDSHSENAYNGLSDISDSILNIIDEKIDILKSPSIARSSVVENSKLLSPCLDCHTQSVMKRLDFSTQCKVAAAIDVAQKENLPPQFREVVPLSADSHLVASWSKQHSKITLPNKPSSFDIRKWKNGVFETHGEGYMDIKKSSARNMNFLLDVCRFDRSVFEGLNVMGQIDNKFIGCVSADDLLVLVDQHAAHERVRLECMLSKLHQNEDKTKPVSSQLLKAMIPVQISKPEREFILNIKSKLQFIGFIIDVSKQHVNLIAVPSICFIDSGDLNISVLDIIASFNQAVYQIRDSEGSNLALPQKLVDYLHSKACHGAIRFGDELTKEQCCILLKQLSVCDLPFQCAHGRPSFAPIVKLNEPKDLSSDSDNKSELCFLKLRSRFQKTQ